MKRVLSAFVASLMLVSGSALAQEPNPHAPQNYPMGVGQASLDRGLELANMSLDDPLVRSKYAKNPDLVRFLRGVYSEACTRGTLNESAKLVLADKGRQHGQEAYQAMVAAVESNRIWKLSSLEMEFLFGEGYIHAAHYCDCLMRELTADDLVNPEKGLEIVDNLSLSTQASCEQLAQERTERYVEKAQGTLKSKMRK